MTSISWGPVSLSVGPSQCPIETAERIELLFGVQAIPSAYGIKLKELGGPLLPRST